MSGSVILILGGLQGLILAAIIYAKRGTQGANQYLAAFVVLLGLGCLLDNSFIAIPESVFVWVWSGNSFLFAPFLYLYITNLTKRNGIIFPTYVTLFLIFFLMKGLVLLVFYFDIVPDPWIPYVGAFVNFFLVVYNVVFGLMIFSLLRKRTKFITQNQVKWARAITLIFISYGILLLLRRIVTDVLYIDLPVVDDYIYLGAVFTLYWMSYQIMNQPGLILQKNKYNKSGLKESDIKDFGERISTYLESSKAFKQSDFNLAQLSEHTDIPKHQLSQVITEHFDKTFYQLIHELRIHEVKRLMDSGDLSHFNILGLANECGFQSKSAFNKAFRDFTGTTPSEYLRSN